MDFKNLTQDELKNYISSRIEFNISQEADASKYYFELLNLFRDETDKEIIKGILRDELNHAIILTRLQEKYSGILPSEFYPVTSLKKKEN